MSCFLVWCWGLVCLFVFLAVPYVNTELLQFLEQNKKLWKWNWFWQLFKTRITQVFLQSDLQRLWRFLSSGILSEAWKSCNLMLSCIQSKLCKRMKITLQWVKGIIKLGNYIEGWSELRMLPVQVNVTLRQFKDLLCLSTSLCRTPEEKSNYWCISLQWREKQTNKTRKHGWQWGLVYQEITQTTLYYLFHS